MTVLTRGTISIERNENPEHEEFNTYSVEWEAEDSAHNVSTALFTGCKTPGEALDKAMKWATDRRMYIPVWVVEFPVCQKVEP